MPTLPLESHRAGDAVTPLLVSLLRTPGGSLDRPDSTGPGRSKGPRNNNRGQYLTALRKENYEQRKGDINRQIADDNKLLKELKARITRIYNWS